jgi:post-segregation antitoxin (ccd killing protein)
MAAWIWVLIPLVAIIGGYIIDYQKNKMKMMNMSRQNEEEVEDVRKLVNSLKTRIENLEAIAAGAPDDFKTGTGAGISEIEIEDTGIKEENRQSVSDIANKRRTQ